MLMLGSAERKNADAVGSWFSAPGSVVIPGESFPYERLRVLGTSSGWTPKAR